MIRFFSKDQLKSNFWALLVCSLVVLIVKLSSTDTITVPVKPNTFNRDYVFSIANFGPNKILAGRLSIEHPTFIQRFLLPNDSGFIDCFTLVGIILCSSFMIILIPKIKESNIFRKDLTRILYLIAVSIILYSFLSVVKDIMYVSSEIKRLTNEQFINQNATTPFLFAMFAYIGVMIIRSVKVYQRGFLLQQEQDLIV